MFLYCAESIKLTYESVPTEDNTSQQESISSNTCSKRVRFLIPQTRNELYARLGFYFGYVVFYFVSVLVLMDIPPRFDDMTVYMPLLMLATNYTCLSLVIYMYYEIKIIPDVCLYEAVILNFIYIFVVATLHWTLGDLQLAYFNVFVGFFLFMLFFLILFLPNRHVNPVVDYTISQYTLKRRALHILCLLVAIVWICVFAGILLESMTRMK
jgi:hypothetical protein